MNARLDLVLVNPGGSHHSYQTLGKKLAAIEPPVWVGLLATFARRRGCSVMVIDANAEGLTPPEVAQRIADLNPWLACVVVYGHQPSASTQNMPNSGATCTAIRQLLPGQDVLLVGGHVAALPKRTLQEEAANFVCTGEGPYTLVSLIAALRAGGHKLHDVPGLCLWADEVPTLTAPAPLVRDLDNEMPGVAWDLLPMSKYRAHNWHCFGEASRTPYAAIYTTLGCPFRCTFCCIQAPFKSGERLMQLRPEVNSYRLWSPRVVLDGIGTLVQDYGIRNIKIADELFVLRPKHVEHICEGIVQRGYDLNIWAYSRVDTLRQPMVEKLKSAGVNWLAFGIEAATERVRDDVQKGFSADKLSGTLDLVRQAGINVIANYIFGLPEDDQDSMQATLELAQELNCEFANFYCTMAYPGSALYRQAIDKGWRLPQSWSGYAQHAVDTLPLPTNHLSAAEVLRFRDRAFNTYFGSPRYLNMVTTKFGEQTSTHLRNMLTHKLERRFA